MCKVIDDLAIRVKVEATDWPEAIRLAGELLLERGSITEKYIDDMIRSVENLGPYMVLTKGFALVHAKPSANVLRTDISLITLASPVNFHSKNDPVEVILCLACVDRVSHIENLKIIAEKLMADGIIGEIAACRDAAAVYKLLKYGHGN